MKKNPPLFPLGQVVATPGALDQIPAWIITAALARHVSGDWGNLCEEDQEENELSLKEGFRILSAYQYEAAPKFWIITEADRSVTTVLLPAEY